MNNIARIIAKARPGKDLYLNLPNVPPAMGRYVGLRNERTADCSCSKRAYLRWPRRPIKHRSSVFTVLSATSWTAGTDPTAPGH